MTRFDSLVLTATTLAAGAAAQQLASFDPAAVPVQEFAAVACAPAPPIGYADDLLSPPAASLWYRGAIAADNGNQRLYYATGVPAHGILRIAFTDIGTGNLPVNYLCPPGFNQLTGMAVDPRVAAGDTLFVTDGTDIGLYHAPTTAFLAPLQQAPLAPGRFLTGLAYDPFGDRLMVVDNASTIFFRALGGGPWSAPITPSVAVPARPTGISFCNVAPGMPFVSYWNGVVIDPAGGLVMPFPPAPGGPRRHRGLTFMGSPIIIGGSGPPPVQVEVEIRNGFHAGNPNTQVEVTSPLGPALLGVDLAPTFSGGIVLSGFGGTLMLNPASSVLLAITGPGTHAVVLSLVGVPPGIGLTFQAAGIAGTPAELSDALFMRTYL